MLHPNLRAAEGALSCALDYAGDLALLDAPRCALLISRTPRKPAPDTPWVSGTLAATRKLSADRRVLVTGGDRAPFELALWTARQQQAPAIVALPAAPNGDERWRELLPELHLLVWPKTPWSKADAPRQRDLLIGALSDAAYAVSVRRNGNMAEVAQRLRERSCPIEDWPLPPVARKPKPVLAAVPLAAAEAPSPWEYLTHFTREPDGSFPGEPYCDYLRWLSSGTPYTPRDAFAALGRIFSEKRLRASARLIRGSTPVVCFTALPPGQAVALRRWRRGLCRWSFSCFGVAIRRQTMRSLGAQPVQYVAPADLKDAAAERAALLQPESSRTLKWSAEAEWRVLGDVDLTRIATEDMLAIVATHAQAALVRREYGIAAQVIYGADDGHR